MIFKCSMVSCNNVFIYLYKKKKNHSTQSHNVNLVFEKNVYIVKEKKKTFVNK